ncbi:MAG: SUMF1/EgtB/PvdO family nonheme iron enzyme [Odoribacter sp.]|nr:SUMF1/EgtB/PvdO family nonheme iron enzyme [Odoribacter sp.]
MKRNLFYWAFCLLLFAGCSKDSAVEKDDSREEPSAQEITLEVSVSDLVFEASGGVKTFAITCNGEWKISGAGDWCTVDADAGNGNRTVSVTAGAYEGMEDRNVNLTVKSGAKTQLVGVTQKHKDAIVLAKDKHDVSQDGGTLTVEVLSNIDYEVTIPETFRSWISPAPDSKAVESKTYRFIIAANDTPESRHGYIVFSGNEVNDTISVYQAQKDCLLLDQDSYDVAATGETFTVELKTNVDYEVVMPDDADWVSRMETRALRTDKLSFSVLKNEGRDDRSALVVVKDKNSELSDTLCVRQSGREVLVLSQEIYRIGVLGDTIAVQVKEGVACEVTIPTAFQSWIVSLGETSSGSFRFAVLANVDSDLKKREGYVLFSDSSLTDTVWVVQEPKVLFTETISGASFDMVYVQGGTFRMGASEDDDEALDWEKPVHEVTLSDYYIGKYEVTQGLWKAVMGENPSYFQKGNNYPVECVSWNDIQTFLTKLSELTGKKYVLPTEAQWEYAARGGAKSQGYKYSGGNDIDEVAWYWGNSEEKYSTSPVGLKKANELGIYDMSGNVWEWCQDWYSSNYYANSPQTDPAGPETGSRRVGRGGSWNHGAQDCRVSYRYDNRPDVRYIGLGFRVALLP